MNKRGQFFLVAALIIISILIELGIMYNNANTLQDNGQVSSLTKEIKYESVQTIDNGYYNNLSTSQIAQNLISIVLNYSESNPDKYFFITYGAQDNITGNYYNNGEEQPMDGVNNKIISSRDNIEVSLNGGLHWKYNITKGYNFHVIIIKEANNERIVASA